MHPDGVCLHIPAVGEGLCRGDRNRGQMAQASSPAAISPTAQPIAGGTAVQNQAPQSERPARDTLLITKSGGSGWGPVLGPAARTLLEHGPRI